MKRREFLRILGATAVTSAVPPGHGQNADGTPNPNIVLCMADDQGWGDMGYNGHAVLKTPHFDAMAAEGLRFNRFYAAAPVCSPTRGSVMTGRHPNRFGCFRWGNTLRPQETTIAEVLKKAGYVTGHFGKWHLGPTYGRSPVCPGASGFDEWFSAPNFFDNNPILSRMGEAVKAEGESSMVAVDAALQFIRRHGAVRRPFLAVVWFGSPHGPHRAIEQDRRPYADQPQRLQHFYGEITGMDRAFGKLRSTLRELGLHDSTILWYCSDNGGLPKVGSTGGRGHKGSIYEGGLRVPAILEWPSRITQPRTTSVPCNTSDILPTLAEIAEVSLNPRVPLDGISLAPLLHGSMDSRPGGMGFWSYPAKGISTPSAKLMTELLQAQQAGSDITDPKRLRLDAAKIEKQYAEDEFPGHAAWLEWPWKLHRIVAGNRPAKLELYNLAEDPMEATDLAPKHSKRSRGMLARLEAWQQSVLRSLNGKDYG